MRKGHLPLWVENQRHQCLPSLKAHLPVYAGNLAMCGPPVYLAGVYEHAGICVSVNVRASTNKRVHLHSVTSQGKNPETAPCSSWEVWESRVRAGRPHPCSPRQWDSVRAGPHPYVDARPSWGWGRVLGKWRLKSKNSFTSMCAHLHSGYKWGSSSFMCPLASILRGIWVSCLLLAPYSQWTVWHIVGGYEIMAGRKEREVTYRHSVLPSAD